MKVYIVNRWKITYDSLPLGVRATFWYAVCNILQKGMSLIAVPIYTRILSTEQYGNYSVFLSWIDIFEIIITLKIAGGGYIAGLTKYSSDRNRYSSSVQGLEISLTTVWLIIYCAFSERINHFTGMNFTMTVLLFILMYAMPIISFWTARQRIEYRYLSSVIVTVTSSLLIPLFGIYAAFQMSSQKENGLIGARIIVQGIIALLIFIRSIKSIKHFYDKKYWGKTLKFNIPLVPYYLSTIILQSSDRIMIKALVSTSSAGIYGVAYSAAMIMQLFNSSIHSALQPWLFDKLQTKKYDDIPQTINFLVFLVASLNLLLIAFAPEAIKILAPPSYHQAIWVVPPLAASVFVMFCYEHFINIEIFYEDTLLIAAASIVVAIVNLLLNFIFIPRMGFLIAGYTTLISYFIFCAIHYFLMRKACRKNNCTLSIIDVRSMLFIMLIFFILVIFLSIGYFFWIIRYGIVIVLIMYIARKKGKIISVLKTLKSKGSI